MNKNFPSLDIKTIEDTLYRALTKTSNIELVFEICKCLIHFNSAKYTQQVLDRFCKALDYPEVAGDSGKLNLHLWTQQAC